MSTHLWIRAEGRDDEVRPLLEWLRHEDQFRGQVHLEQAAIGPSQMGGISDVLIVALGSGGTGAVLAGSLRTWLSNRRSDVKLIVSTKDGRRVELDARRVPDVHILVREIERLAQPPESLR